VSIIGIGGFGIDAINKLKQGGIYDVKYGYVNYKNKIAENLNELMCGADLVFIIANTSSDFSVKTISQLTSLCENKSQIMILILQIPGDYIVSENLLINELKDLSDILFIISSQKPQQIYNQVYFCVKAIIYFRGSRIGLINTGLKDIAGCIRDSGIGYIGFGKAKGKNAIAAATDKAIKSLENNEKLQNARSFIATISCQDCSMENTLPFFEEIRQKISDTANFHYNIYPNNDVTNFCSVIILAIG
jgi:cell division GTPase FtsZ